MNLEGKQRTNSRSGTFLWVWGGGFHGQLGIAGSKRSAEVPICLEFPKNVAICQVAWYDTAPCPLPFRLRIDRPCRVAPHGTHERR